MKFSGAVLAGGKSSRFGTDKARFIYKGKAMMRWVLESLEPASERFIIANETYDEFDFPIYADVISNQTPLSGIHSALVHAKHDWAAIAACDMPFLTRDYWKILVQYCSGSTNAIVIKSQEGLEPLAAFFHRSSRGSIETALKQEQKAVHQFLQNIEVTVLNAEDLDLPRNTFLNINRLEDIQAL
ncbi:MAG: molybdenum cofactor guanylyltransferase [Trueperaceae bacterium]